MRRLLLGLLVTVGVFFALGYTWAEKTQQIRISTRTDDAMRFYVLITLPSVTADVRWFDVFVCAATIDSEAVVRCEPGGWEAMSGKEPRVDQRQYEIPLGRYVPRGPKLILAEAYDQRWKVVATGRAVVLR